MAKEHIDLSTPPPPSTYPPIEVGRWKFMNLKLPWIRKDRRFEANRILIFFGLGHFRVSLELGKKLLPIPPPPLKWVRKFINRKLAWRESKDRILFSLL
jgi:hypothetical protein